MSAINRVLAILYLIAAAVVGPFYGNYAEATFLLALGIFCQNTAMDGSS